MQAQNHRHDDSFVLQSYACVHVCALAVVGFSTSMQGVLTMHLTHVTTTQLRQIF